MAEKISWSENNDLVGNSNNNVIVRVFFITKNCTRKPQNIENEQILQQERGTGAAADPKEDTPAPPTTPPSRTHVLLSPPPVMLSNNVILHVPK